MVYGLPYKGSKNIIAKRIVDALPSGTNFVDCCCGGGAIVQAATLSGKFKTVTGYDISKSIIGLLQATMVDFGKIDYENFPVVSKEEFCAARDRNETINDFLIPLIRGNAAGRTRPAPRLSPARTFSIPGTRRATPRRRMSGHRFRGRPLGRTTA